ncbi:hypothetical protein BH09MYX1_BH09MYX1_00940 [soil metagenome]
MNRILGAILATLAFGCGGRVDPIDGMDAGFDPDSSTILLPREACGEVLAVPGGQVFFGEFAQAQDSYLPATCGSLGVGGTPNKALTVQTFGLMRTPVTNGCYAECVKAGSCSEPAPSSVDWRSVDRRAFPVGKVSFAQAQTFCAWAGGRLPTIVQATRAAQGGVAFPGVKAMTEARIACQKNFVARPDCARFESMTLFGPSPDHTNFAVDTLATDTAPFGHRDVAAMGVWTRSYLGGSYLADGGYCSLPDGAPDFVSGPREAESFAIAIAEFQSTLLTPTSGFSGPVGSTESMISARVGVRCAF